jgi:hypothetical protein
VSVFHTRHVLGLIVSHDHITEECHCFRYKASSITLVSQPANPRYQTKLLDMQREGKIAPQVLQQLANEQLMEAFIKEQ